MAPDPQCLRLVVGRGPRGLRQRLGPGVWEGSEQAGPPWRFQEGMAGGARRGEGQACVGTCVSLHPCAQCVRVCMGMGWHMDQRVQRHSEDTQRRRAGARPQICPESPLPGSLAPQWVGGGATFISSPRRLCAAPRRKQAAQASRGPFSRSPRRAVQAPHGHGTRPPRSACSLGRSNCPLCPAAPLRRTHTRSVRVSLVPLSRPYRLCVLLPRV